MKKKFGTPPPYGDPKLLHGSIATYRKTKNKKKWKFWLRIDDGQNVFQWTLNELLWHLKLNWLTALDPSVSLLASDAYFQLKWLYFVYLAVYGTENLNNSNQNDLGGSFQFIGTHFYHNQNKIQNFFIFFLFFSFLFFSFFFSFSFLFFFFFAFLQVLLGGMWTF